MSASWEPFGPTRRNEPGLGVEPSGTPAAPASEPAGREAAAPVPPRPEPRHALAIITCMDARIDPLAVLGLSLGDANVIRNAGAMASDDVLRSLSAAFEKLGVRRAVVMGHTNCAGHGSDAAAAAAVADGARRVRAAMPDGFEVDTVMYDVADRGGHAGLSAAAVRVRRTRAVAGRRRTGAGEGWWGAGRCTNVDRWSAAPSTRRWGSSAPPTSIPPLRSCLRATFVHSTPPARRPRLHIRHTDGAVSSPARADPFRSRT